MKRPVLRLVLLSGTAFALFLGYKLRSSAPDTPIDIKLIVRQAQAAQSAVNAQNKFGLRLLNRELSQHPKQNVLVAPLSIWQCGAMAQLGAGGITKAGLRSALSIPSAVQDAQLNKANMALRATLKAQNGVTLNVANALWSGKQFPIRPTFARDCQTSFGAEANTVDFSSPQTAQSVNDWVSTQTEGKISEIVGPRDFDETNSLCLTNAVYFHGRWKTPFDANDTKDAVFHRADGTTQTMPFMHLDDLEHAYTSGTTFEAVCLPYHNSTCALWALLPRAGKGIRNVLAEFDASELRNANRDKVNVQLPRFRMEAESELSEDLKALGASVAFSREADFSSILHQQSYISTVRHKALIEVDEEGTTAAAATSIWFSLGGSADVTPTVIFDRPFVAALVEEKSGALLILGVVNAPEQLN